MSDVPTYGLDIETDTGVDGLDPRVASVVAVAIAGEGVELVLEADEAHEAALLRELDGTLAELPPGVIVTWNGAGFDLPFLHDRARHRGVPLGLRLVARADIGGRRDPLPGHTGAYRAMWHRHRHLDGYQLFRSDVGATVGLSCGLKSLARFVGLPVVEVDRSRIHELTGAERRAYVASDARLARELVIRRVDHRRAIDQFPDTIGT